MTRCTRLRALVGFVWGIAIVAACSTPPPPPEPIAPPEPEAKPPPPPPPPPTQRAPLTSEQLDRRMARIADVTVSRLAGPDSTPQLPYDQDLDKQRTSFPYARFQDIQIPSGELTLNAWMVKPAAGHQIKGTVLVLHDWADNRARGLETASFLLREGYQLFIPDARSNLFIKKPREFWGFLKEDIGDLERVMRYLGSRDDVKMNRLAVYGCGWGGLKAILAGANHKKIRAIVDDSGPLHYSSITVDYMNKMPPAARTDYARITKFISMVKAGIFAKLGYDIEAYDPRVAVKKLTQPLLITHGANDNYVPIGFSKEIFQSAKEPKTFLEGENFGHCEGMKEAPDVYIPAVLKFLEENLGPKKRRKR